MVVNEIPQVDLLIVEDDPDLRLALVEILEEEGYRVAPAAHGGEALILLHSGMQPRVILSDLWMPEMNGWQFAENLGSDPRLAGIPLVLLSALYDSRLTEPLPQAHGYLPKPIQLPRLLAEVQRFCLPLNA